MRILLIVLMCFPVVSAVEMPTDLKAWSWAEKLWQKPPEFMVAIEPGREPRPALAITATTADWDHCLTRTVMLADQPATVRLRGWFRTEGVVEGSKEWMNGRFMLQFLNAQLQHLDPWPSSNGASGTIDWKWVDQELIPPPGTRALSIRLELTMCTGRAWFQDLSLEAFAADGSAVAMTEPSTQEITNTTGWWPFIAHEAAADAERVVDWSSRFERPAGRSGRIRSVGGHFVSGNGQRIRFNGTSIGPGDFLGEREKSARLAERLACSGFNLVRLHHLDAGFSTKNLFAKNGGTRELDAQALDDLCFFTAELKKRGIYLWCDLLVTRRFTEQDGVADAQGLPLGAKIAGLFDERLIALQQEYARQLLTHKNPYTGLSLVADPQMAFIGIINENSVFLNGPISSWDAIPAVYREALDARWQADRSRRKLPVASVPVDRAWRQGDADAIAFLGAVQKSFYLRMMEFLRSELKTQALFTGNNFGVEVPADRQAGSVLDFDDVHAYWDHPAGGWGPTDGFSNLSQVKTLNSSRANFPFAIAANRRAGRPLTISEWGVAFPNTHVAENPLVMAAFAGWNDVDGVLPFVFSNADWSPSITGVFTMGDMPPVTLPLIAYNLSLLRGDFAAGPALLFPVGKIESLPPSAVFAGRLIEADSAAMPVAGGFKSPAGELELKGEVFTVVSPRTQGAAGSLDTAPVHLSALRLALHTAGQVGIVSLDDLALGDSRRILLVATARAENTGQVFKGGWQGLKAVGQAPILLEPVVGIVAVRVPAGQVRVTILDADGRRTTRTIAAKTTAGWTEIALGSEPFLWAEIVVAP